ncbi:MAG: hypothetical protein Q8O99_06960 [bacterium]|nr:hypothetical protein [bacterium]
MLAQRLQEPTNDVDVLQSRQEMIETRHQDRNGAVHLRSLLQPIGDMPRVLQKISTGTGSTIGLLVQLRDRLLPVIHDEQLKTLV